MDKNKLNRLNDKEIESINDEIRVSGYDASLWCSQLILYELLMRTLDEQKKLNVRLDAIEGKKTHVEDDRFKTLDYVDE